MQLPSQVYHDKTLQVIYLSALYMSYIADLEKDDSKKADDSIQTDDSARMEARIDLNTTSSLDKLVFMCHKTMHAHIYHAALLQIYR